MNATETKYACPMHPEIQGKLNGKCSICGMFLTIPVPENGENLDSKFVDFGSFMSISNKNIIQNNQI